MGYVERNLGKDEKILARVTHSKWGLASSILVCLLFVIIIVVVQIVIHRVEDYSGESLDYEAIFIQIIIYLLMSLCGIYMITNSVIQIFYSQLVVTNKRVLGRFGLISKRVVDILLLKLDSVNAENGLFGAIFHYGTLTIVSAGTVGRPPRFPYVNNTEEFRRAVLEAVDKAKAEERQAQAAAQAAAIKRAQDQGSNS